MVQSQAPRSYTIGKLADAAGVGVETVRFYQRSGLMAKPERFGGIRRYDQDDLRRLHFIRHAKEAGFTLREIAELLELDRSTERARARQLATARIEALDARIAQLQGVRASLARLAQACVAEAEGPCPILASFDS